MFPLWLLLLMPSVSSAWREAYEAAMEEYFDGPALECIRSQTFDLWSSKEKFETMGLEGVGHHIIEKLPPEITGGYRHPGNQDSFPFGRDWATDEHIDGDVRMANVKKIQEISHFSPGSRGCLELHPPAALAQRRLVPGGRINSAQSIDLRRPRCRHDQDPLLAKALYPL